MSKGWLSQRLNNSMVRGKRAMFREEDYHIIAEAFRNISKRLQTHADEIDNAKMDEE